MLDDRLHNENNEAVAAVGFWWHSIDLGGGLVSPGHKSASQLAQELKSMKLPDLHGKSVLDMGAWDGFFSFEAERLGASRVVAMDYHAWHSDMDKLFRQRNEKQSSKGNDETNEAPPQIWYQNELPGKRAFDLAARLRNSRVESIDADFMSVDLDQVGMFDITLFLGVLYHTRNPLLSLERIARLTKELAVIETEAIVLPGYEDLSVCEFYETDELNKDASNWWAPTLPALLGMCRAAGFKQAEALNDPPMTGKRARLKTAIGGAKPVHYRAFVHAWK